MQASGAVTGFTTDVQRLLARQGDMRVTGRVEIVIDGTDNVPVAIELAFRKGGELKGVLPSPHGIEDAYLSQNGVPVEYEFEGDKIRVSAGMQEHTWTQLRGALPKLDAMCVYLTGITPFKRKLRISAM